ncbi:MAG: helix-turn-helix transcriptional regulator [Clostridiales bacterium]|nr:helix-turn-helix transcriptional regulator [Clostridiales bacterium]
MDKKVNLGEQIRKYRKQKRYSQENLADLLGKKRYTVDAWERNRSTPDEAMMIKIADVLGIQVDDLYGRQSFEDKQTLESLNEISDQADGITRRAKSFQIDFKTPEDVKRYYRKRIAITIGIFGLIILAIFIIWPILGQIEVQ